MRSSALNVRSEYSLDTSLVRVDALLDRARELKMDVAGLVDRASLLGIPHFVSGAHRRGLHVLLGVELPLESSVPDEAARGVTFPLVLYATSAEAVGQLARFVSCAQERGRTGSHRGGACLVWDDLTRPDLILGADPLNGLIAQSPGQTGEVSVRILRGQMDQAEWLALRLAEVFGRSSFFAGISIYGRSAYGRSTGAESKESPVSSARPRALEARLADETEALTRRLGLSVVVSNGVDHLHPEEAHARETLEFILRNETRGTVAGLGVLAAVPSGASYLRTPAELESLFRNRPEALAGLERLIERAALDPAELIREWSRSSVQAVPAHPPAADSELAWHCARVSRKRNGGRRERDRLQQELGLIRQAGLASQLLQVAALIEAGRAAGVPARLRREPVTGSLVAHYLGLTPVDPLSVDLPFRLTVGAAETPTRIAIEVAEEDQERWLECADAAEGCLMPTRIHRFGALEALRDVALVSGIPADLMRRAAMTRVAAARHELSDPVGMNSAGSTSVGSTSAGSTSSALDPIAEIFRNDPYLARAYHQDERVRAWFDTARRIVGLPRRLLPNRRARILGIRLPNGPSRRFRSEEPQAQATRGGERFPLWFTVDARPVAQWTGEHPGFGPVFLLEVVSPCTYALDRLFPEQPAIEVPSAEVPSTENREVPAMSVSHYSVSQRSESNQRTPSPSAPSLHDVAEAVALERLAPGRPGLAERFVRRRRGVESFHIADPALKPVLAPTFGLLLFEEQLIDIAVRVAAFSAQEAEAFQRDLAARPGTSTGSVAGWRIKFVRGAVDRGLEAQRAEEIFNGLVTVGAGTICRAECVADAMRLLRETHGFGARRDGRLGAQGVTPLPLPKPQLVLPWLETTGIETDDLTPVQLAPAGSRRSVDEPLRKQA